MDKPTSIRIPTTGLTVWSFHSVFDAKFNGAVDKGVLIEFSGKGLDVNELEILERGSSRTNQKEDGYYSGEINVTSSCHCGCWVENGIN